MNLPLAHSQSIERATTDRRVGLARSVRSMRRRPRTPDAPEPLTFDPRLTADAALDLLGRHGQAMAFVVDVGGRGGVVTAEDLRFAREWAGPRATVSHAVTQALVDLSPNEQLTFPTDRLRPAAGPLEPT